MVCDYGVWFCCMVLMCKISMIWWSMCDQYTNTRINTYTNMRFVSCKLVRARASRFLIWFVLNSMVYVSCHYWSAIQPKSLTMWYIYIYICIYIYIYVYANIPYFVITDSGDVALHVCRRTTVVSRPSIREAPLPKMMQQSLPNPTPWADADLRDDCGSPFLVVRPCNWDSSVWEAEGGEQHVGTACQISSGEKRNDWLKYSMRCSEELDDTPPTLADTPKRDGPRSESSQAIKSED